ncbi:hypothetical protein BCV69DRAFT_269260 [Microstroma glucosiphilum]|uniref:Uncharacterized protein n=1 Tax=Pseudomicrostroma glucosiphilum TaxID=1684307 RepID=A0A316UAL5_9BASI|nr:hypothetical protein BCV69DRAFT_269260 [Pseudomicrostroma glucosiphilum]PWN21511.1 hypothetical protein BCV69DRAFT_269260 [Pseudomicrostroma glucosiphilum]
MAGESRSELLAWLNELLNLNYTKVEQCGSGFAYAQIIDSIYGNVPMSRLHANAKQEYEFINNFKVLQAVFKKNRISKPIPVDMLIKCRMLDNLEFLQWIKGFWDTNYPGTPYDPDARRAGVVAAPPPLIGAASVGSARPLPGRGNAVAPAAPRAKPSVGARAASGSSAAAARRPGGGSGAKVSSGGVNDQAYQALLAERDDLHAQAEIITSEREFYWHKLTQIEGLVNDRLAQLEPEEGETPTSEGNILRDVKGILYATDDGGDALAQDVEGLDLVDGEEEEVF